MTSDTKSNMIGYTPPDGKEKENEEGKMEQNSLSKEEEHNIEEGDDGHVEKKQCKNGVASGGNTETSTPGPQSTSSQAAQSATGGSSNGSKIQTVFIHKLYDMLEDVGISHLIWWASNNESFYLLPGEEFSKVLAQYFKHTNIASFIRQLNMYGFHKVNDTFPGSDDSQGGSFNKWEFKHSTNQFRKGDIESLKLIKRRSSKNVNSHKEIVNLKSIPTSHPINTDDEQNADPQKEYHQSLQKQQDQQQAHYEMDSSTKPSTPQPPGVPNQHLPQSARSHSNSSISQPPPLVSKPSFENFMNYKVVELGNNHQALKNEFNNLAQRYDFVNGELHRTQADFLQLIDVLEKNFVTNSSNASEGVEQGQERTPKPSTINEDANVSPRKSLGNSLQCGLAMIKANLLSRVNNTGPSHPPPQAQQYHLNTHQPSITSQMSGNNPSIVPQHYPLNPYYTIYSQEPPYRQISIDESQGHTNRNYSILVDPLHHPVPSRDNSRLQDDSHRRTDTKSYSPLSVSGHVANQHQIPLQFQSPAGTPVQSSLNNYEKSNLSRTSSFVNQVPHDQTRNYHQYPFPLMTSNEQAGQSNTLTRNNSMLSINDPGTPDHQLSHVHSAEGVHQYQPPVGSQQPVSQHQIGHHYLNRNSQGQLQTQSQPQHQTQQQQQLPQPPPPPQQQQSSQNLKTSNHPSVSANNSNVSTPNAYPPRSVPPNSNSSNSVFTTASSSETVATVSSSAPYLRNQLPSVSELDKSIKVGNSHVANLLNNAADLSSKPEKPLIEDT